MDLKINLNKEELDSFLITNDPQFLQSFAWGEFQKSLNKNVWQIGVIENNELQAVCQIIENRLPLSRSYLYVPRGPVFKADLNPITKEIILKFILKGIRDIEIETKTYEEIFLRLEPVLLNNEINLSGLNLRKIKTVQPKDTTVLDLNLTEEQLLQNMHQKTRYNIRLAEKKNIQIRLGGITDYETFWELMAKTSNRDNFRSYPKSYYEQLLKVLGTTDDSKDFRIKLWLAELDNQPLAAALIGYFGDTATYLHGASDYQFHNLMAPYLLHWQIIKDAKNKNYKKYDFWGIAPTKVKNEQSSWRGLTRFKLGFGGNEINYAGTYDYVYDQLWYKLYNLVKKIL